MLIGLTGKSGSGKNLIADHLCSKWNFVQFAVADAIREEVERHIKFHWNGPKDAPLGSKLGTKDFDAVLVAYQKSVWAKPTSPEMRVMLQWYGDYRREVDPLYFVKALEEQIKVAEGNGWDIVISDVRLEEEADMLKHHGGEIWSVEREGLELVGIEGHKTEVRLPTYWYNCVVFNDGTVEELLKYIDLKMAGV